MTNEQWPVQFKGRKLIMWIVAAPLLIGGTLVFLMLGWATVDMVMSSDSATGLIALVVLCISAFCSYRHTRKQLKLRDKELRVRLDTPREGLAIVSGIVELPPQSDPVTCEITGRECVAYSFTLREVVGDLEFPLNREVFSESQSVPFVIRSEYGTAKVTGPLEPAPSTIESYCSFADTEFLECNQLTQEYLCTHGGFLCQFYAELLPGAFVTLLGKLSVDTDGGALLEDAEFSTQAKPVFETVSSAANLERVPAFLSLCFVISSGYLLWLLFTTG